MVDGGVVAGTTFNYSGAIETYIVPDGVYALYVKLLELLVVIVVVLRVD